MKVFFNHLHYTLQTKPVDRAMVSLLTPISAVYSAISELRSTFYKTGVLKTYRPSVLTISVGNLTTGGTGKTPITAEIANFLVSQGYKPAILSRGYGSKLNSKKINIISNGKNIFYTDGRIAGDEPLWLSQNCPNCAVLTSSNRVQIAKYAEHKLGCDVLILDDGYQHMKIARDINICVVDSRKLFGNKRILPAGPLRENIGNLSRADKIIVVGKDGKSCLSSAIQELQQITTKEIFTCKLEPEKVYETHTNAELPTQSNILAFSAIGQPEQFYNFLRKNYNVVKTIDFADHHIYSKTDVNTLFAQAEQNNATLVTTEKDGVKIKPLTNKPLYQLRLSPTLDVAGLLNIGTCN